jgi:hypothetical protein
MRTLAPEIRRHTEELELLKIENRKLEERVRSLEENNRAPIDPFIGRQASRTTRFVSTSKEEKKPASNTPAACHMMTDTHTNKNVRFTEKMDFSTRHNQPLCKTPHTHQSGIVPHTGTKTPQSARQRALAYARTLDTHSAWKPRS